MHSTLSIEIDDNDETCEEAAVIKARRRRAHICLAIQQTGLFTLCCIVLAYSGWGSFFKAPHTTGIGSFIVAVSMAFLTFTVVSEVIYEHYQYNGVHNFEYDIHCGKYFIIMTPWYIKWLIRKGKKLLKR